MASRARNSKLRSQKNCDWQSYSDEDLLDLRICDLGLRIENSAVAERVNQLYGELENRGLTFRPRVWLSDDWFSPDGIPGIAVPFFVAHPRLARLERAQMLEVEGGTRQWCMKILRHEAGHAYDTAFRIHRRQKYRGVFGRYSSPYPESYRPKPFSKDYVLHLEPWYAQSHPSEDFAETFAVWLKPRSRWRSEYQHWPCLKKIEYVDQVMNEIGSLSPPVNSRRKFEPVSQIKQTLREHYARRRQFYGYGLPTSFDDDLKKLFCQERTGRNRRLAATYLSRHRNEFARLVATRTGEYQYNIQQVLREMIERCRELDLKIPSDSVDAGVLKKKALKMITVHTMHFLHSGTYQRVAM